jgi:hypothetical protein
MVSFFVMHGAKLCKETSQLLTDLPRLPKPELPELEPDLDFADSDEEVDDQHQFYFEGADIREKVR